MYERFTDRARKVMQLANQEAQRFNHEYIGTEHILLGLVKEGSGVAANVLKNLDIDLRKIRLEVEKIVQAGPDMVTMGKLPQTPSAFLPGYRTFMNGVRVLDVTEAIARRAVGLWSRLRLGGQRVRDTDLLIAATALVHGLTLVTHATGVYANIPGLTVEDWTQP